MSQNEYTAVIYSAANATAHKLLFFASPGLWHQPASQMNHCFVHHQVPALCKFLPNAYQIGLLLMAYFLCWFSRRLNTVSFIGRALVYLSYIFTWVQKYFSITGRIWCRYQESLHQKLRGLIRKPYLIGERIGYIHELGLKLSHALPSNGRGG